MAQILQVRQFGHVSRTKSAVSMPFIQNSMQLGVTVCHMCLFRHCVHSIKTHTRFGCMFESLSAVLSVCYPASVRVCL